MRLWPAYLLIFLLGLLPGPCWAGPLSDAHFGVPAHWQAVPVVSGNIQTLRHSDGESRIQIIASIPANDEESDAKAVSFYRGRAMYDSWMTLVSRPASRQELQRAGVSQGYVSVYAKDIVENPVEQDKQLVAEYCFVKGRITYVVKIATRQSRWSDLEESVSEFLDNFWVGPGEKPRVKLTKTVAPNADARWKLSWQKFGSAALGTQFLDNHVVIAELNQIALLSGSSGSPNWTVSVEANLVPPVVLEDSVYTVAGTQNVTLIRLDRQTGQTLGRYPLPPRVFIGAPVVDGDTLYLVHESGIIALDSSGRLRWEKLIGMGTAELCLSPDFMVVVTKGQSNITALSRYSGSARWTSPDLGQVLGQPIVLDKKVIVISRQAEKWIAWALELPTGKVLWRSVLPKNITPLCGPKNTTRHFALIAQGKNGLEAHVYDSEKGKKIADFLVNESERLLGNQVTILNQRLYFLTMDQGDTQQNRIKLNQVALYQGDVTTQVLLTLEKSTPIGAVRYQFSRDRLWLTQGHPATLFYFTSE